MLQITETVSIVIKPSTVLKLLLSIILLLLSVHVIGLIFRLYFGHDYLSSIVNLFDFNSERNIPTLYSSLALIIVSTLLLLIASVHKKLNNPYILWIILSAIFLFLSIDEMSSIHEKVGTYTNLLLGTTIDTTSGFFHYAWVIPYAIFLLVFVIMYFKLLLSLPKNIMILFLISGTIFVLGAVGFEILGGWQADLNGKKGLLYSLFYTCEELLEMLGIAIFIYTLLKYITIEFKSFELSIVNNKL